MTDTNPLPPLPEPEGVIVVGTQALRAFTAYQMRTYALQARAQVQGEQFGYIHHFVAHDEHGALIDTTWEADGCADALPHPTQPAAWKWSHATPFYTTPQPAQATQAEAKTDVRCEGCGYMTHHREHMGCVRAAKQFTHPAPGVPDGWKLVPIEPTQEMLAAVSWPECARTDWAHMLAASPAQKGGE